eukprot:TRINITY_DN254_c0_g1_i12.p2 TRINITY_DN254_c0_g1~~TRINITY_DN254_c0_g1_i12.p2  ORF type:complete len:232 (+),score=-9.66 TRINITY_DN254_c0_g1_i12:1017-1712(+)
MLTLQEIFGMLQNSTFVSFFIKICKNNKKISQNYQTIVYRRIYYILYYSPNLKKKKSHRDHSNHDKSKCKRTKQEEQQKPRYQNSKNKQRIVATCCNIVICNLLNLSIRQQFIIIAIIIFIVAIFIIIAVNIIRVSLIDHSWLESVSGEGNTHTFCTVPCCFISHCRLGYSCLPNSNIVSRTSFPLICAVVPRQEENKESHQHNLGHIYAQVEVLATDVNNKMCINKLDCN